MPDPLFPEMPSGMFDDVPLFREIQRVLSASRGPVNWELARQIGIAMASWEKDDPDPGPDEIERFEAAVRSAELQVANFTGMEPPTDVARVEVVRRARWVEANADSLAEFVEPAAARLGDALGRMRPGTGTAPEEGAASAQMQTVLGQITPLLLGAQAGTVLGYLGQNVLGQYDIALPRAEPGRLLFVWPNIAGFQRDWSLDAVEFREWVALHEVTHRFEFSRPWARTHFLGLLRDFVSTLELDVAGLEERLHTIDFSNTDAMQALLESEDGLFGAVLDDEQRLKLARIQSFMAAAEGYADHVMHALGGRLLGSYRQIEEAMRRYRETESSDPVFERLLGIEMKRERYREGRRFCDAVAAATDEVTIARVWDSPESLPSMPEIEEPLLWTSRIV